MSLKRWMTVVIVIAGSAFIAVGALVYLYVEKSSSARFHPGKMRITLGPNRMQSEVLSYMKQQNYVSPRTGGELEWVREPSDKELFHDVFVGLYAPGVVEWAKANPKVSSELFTDVGALLHRAEDYRELKMAALLVKKTFGISDEGRGNRTGIELYRKKTEGLRRRAGLIEGDVEG